MSPRNPIGMSEGAKKRAARIWFCAFYGRPDRCKKTDLPGRKPLTRRYRLKHLWPSIRNAYEESCEDISKDALLLEARALFRVGERLRPCPALGLEPRRWIEALHRPGEAKPCAICDGSGVVPARKRGRQ